MTDVAQTRILLISEGSAATTVLLPRVATTQIEDQLFKSECVITVTRVTLEELGLGPKGSKDERTKAEKLVRNIG